MTKLLKNRKLKVISICHAGIKLSSGRQRYHPLFDNKDIDLTLIVPDRWNDYKKIVSADPVLPGTSVMVEKIRFRHFPKVEWYLHYYPRLGRIINELKPDVIHLWEEPWALVSLQAAYVRNKYAPEAALLLETDQNILRRLPTPFEQLRRYMLKQTDLLIGRCDEALDVSRACGYVGPTAIVEYGIDRTHFAPEGKAEAREEYGTDCFTIGYVGRLVPYKGIDDVLDAMVLSKHRIMFHILGDGPDKQRLIARFTSLGLANKIKLYDSCPPQDVAKFMRSIDTLVLMSRTTKTWKEQFGRVIMEAHACDIPVIGSDSGSIPSVIGEGGWVVKEGDSIALSHLLDHLASNPQEVVAAGKIGLEQADTRFSFDVIAKDLLQAYIVADKERKLRLNQLELSS